MKRSKKQSKEIDFESAVKSWEKKKISRDQLAERLKKLGFDDPEFVIEDLERERLSNKLQQALNRVDMEEAQEAAMEILDKYGERKGWMRPKE